jgi:hypothetical protein
VPVTDPQYATLRALLTGNSELHRNLRSQLTQDADSEGYSALIAAAFFLAADKRFAGHHTTADIVEFVAWATSEDAAKVIDPLLAERMIRGSSGTSSWMESPVRSSSRTRCFSSQPLYRKPGSTSRESMSSCVRAESWQTGGPPGLRR